MSYLAKIQAKSAVQVSAKTDKTPQANDSVSSGTFGTAPSGAFPEKIEARDQDATIRQVLAAAVAGIPVTADELRAELADNDLDTWQSGDVGLEQLRALAQATQDGRDRQAGRRSSGL